MRGSRPSSDACGGWVGGGGGGARAQEAEGLLGIRHSLSSVSHYLSQNISARAYRTTHAHGTRFPQALCILERDRCLLRGRAVVSCLTH